jgi:anti-anti-sigma regulatory factor
VAGRGPSAKERSKKPDSEGPDQDSGFMQRVMRYVESADTDWGPSATAGVDPDWVHDRSALQVMVERKRRNDFVRRQEFELLRRIRREGLRVRELRTTQVSGENFESTIPLAPDRAYDERATVRGKIDEVERTMAGTLQGSGRGSRQSADRPADRPASGNRLSGNPDLDEPTTITAPDPDPFGRDRPGRFGADAPIPKIDLDFRETPPSPMPAPGANRSVDTAAKGGDAVATESEPPSPTDHDLEDAAYALANADFQGCERILQRLIAPGGRLEAQLEVWLMQLDLHRATGQKARFDAIALECQSRFGRQPLAWVSIPRLAMGVPAASVHQAGKKGSGVRAAAQWHCPPMLDVAAVTALRQWAATTPGTVVVDWSQVQMVDGPGAQRLYVLMMQWASSTRPMRWRGVDALVELLEFAAPAGDAQSDRIFWMLRLAMWRLLDRKASHAVVGQAMAQTYAVPEPTWEPPTRAVIELRALETQDTPQAQDDNADLELSSSDFMVSIPPRGQQDRGTVRIELSGQITGDIGSALMSCESATADAGHIVLDCSRLIRMDFIAAGELLNWISTRHGEGKRVEMRELHRLVALFLSVMGAKEHATMATRTN